MEGKELRGQDGRKGEVLKQMARQHKAHLRLMG